MTKEDFNEIFKKGFNKSKFNYEDAENGESEIKCFICGEQAGLKDDNGETKVICLNNHKEKLIKYTGEYIEIEHDLLNCKLNKNCQEPIQGDY